MKQRITKRQLKELSNDEILKLNNFMIGAGYYEDNDLHPTAQANSKRKVGMKLTIGRMIEFLADNRQNKDGTWELIEITQYADSNEWDVCTKGLPTPNYKELADALWEAVKEVLDH